MQRRVVWLMLSLTFIPLGCSLRKSAVSVMGGISWDGQGVLEAESDVGLARETTPALIISLDVLHQSDPSNRRFSALLAKAYGQYAFGFYEEDLLNDLDPKGDRFRQSFSRADRFYQKGREIGLGALKRKGVFRKGLQETQVEYEHALQAFGKRDAPLLFWTAFCWAGSMNLHRDEPSRIVDLPRVVSMVDRVLALTPTYAFGSAWAFRGVIDASRPPMLGGNPENARAAFERALKVEPRYLMTKVLYAQYYAVQIQDWNLFEHLLHEVLAADEHLFPEQQLANALAKRRAELLLKHAEKWF